MVQELLLALVYRQDLCRATSEFAILVHASQECRELFFRAKSSLRRAVGCAYQSQLEVLVMLFASGALRCVCLMRTPLLCTCSTVLLSAAAHMSDTSYPGTLVHLPSQRLASSLAFLRHSTSEFLCNAL
jgi:hypothetical protein